MKPFMVITLSSEYEATIVYPDGTLEHNAPHNSNWLKVHKDPSLYKTVLNRLKYGRYRKEFYWFYI